MTASAFRILPKTALNAAIALVIGCAFAGGAFAQDSELSDEYKEKPKSTTATGSAAAAGERARERKAEAANKANMPMCSPRSIPSPPAAAPMPIC